MPKRAECLAAHTPCVNPYPPYLNATLFPDDHVEVYTRAAAGADGSCGAGTMISLPLADFRKFCVSALAKIEELA